jgi:hypothetical protein
MIKGRSNMASDHVDGGRNGNPSIVVNPREGEQAGLRVCRLGRLAGK